MKILIAFVACVITVNVNAQQGSSLASLLPGTGMHFGLHGIGNLNTESFNNVNGSGKLSGFVQLLQPSTTRSLTACLSFNRNATNDDSTLASTLLFPDIGKSSFIGTVNYIRQSGTSNHYWGPYGQVSFKSIKGKRQIPFTERDTTLLFSIIDWQMGLRYFNNVNPGPDTVIFSLSVFLNYYNVPDEDGDDYRYIINDNNMNGPSDFWGLGVKVALEVNRLQLFADIRHVFGSEKRMPNRDLRGHNINIGVLFNADFYER